MGDLMPEGFDLAAFVVATLLLGGWAAAAAGRAVAASWGRFPILILYVAGLAAAVRFLHYAVFGERLLSLPLFLVDYLVLLAVAGLVWRAHRAGQMANRYGWLYERAGALGWREARRDARETGTGAR